MRIFSRFSKGFSFVELLVSLAIIGILASIAIPFVEITVRRDKEKELKTSLRDIRNAIDQYKQAVDDGKIILQPNQNGYPSNLLDLVIGVNDITTPNKKIYFLRKIPRDPFHPDKTIAAIETWGLRSYSSSPDSPQSGDDVYDVYSTSNQIGLNGVEYSKW